MDVSAQAHIRLRVQNEVAYGGGTNVDSVPDDVAQRVMRRRMHGKHHMTIRPGLPLHVFEPVRKAGLGKFARRTERRERGAAKPHERDAGSQLTYA